MSYPRPVTIGRPLIGAVVAKKAMNRAKMVGNIFDQGTDRLRKKDCSTRRKLKTKIEIKE